MSVIDSRVVVSCAGGGKTTQLINQMMTLLRGGAIPREILIITFTKKAAAEIHDRLLAELEKAAQTDPKMAALRRRILLAASPRDVLTVHTFHSWFLTLLRHRPGGFFSPPNVCEDAVALFDESWRRWQKRAEESPSSELKTALQTVLRELTPDSLRGMCGQFLQHYAVYRLYKETNNETRTPFSAAEFADTIAVQLTDAKNAAAAFAKICNAGGKTVANAKNAAMRIANNETTPEEEEKNFFTKENEVNKILQKSAAKNGCETPLRELTDAMQNYLIAREETRAREFNAAALSVCEDFAREQDALLSARDEMTFDDIEFRACMLMRGDGIRKQLAYRLSAAYRHILIDEFQDTSPMQWRVVREWLHDMHGEESPSVFIVGDPKQAIYGFRGGDYRLLCAADKFLQTYYRAKPGAPQSKCHRCDEKILEFVNAVFDETILDGFAPHIAAGKNIGGRVEWFCDSKNESNKSSPKKFQMRDPLREVKHADEKPLRRARAVARKTKEVLDEWRIPAFTPDGEKTTRACRPEDILILMPQQTHAVALKNALSEYDIPCAGGGGSFLDSFACADILDLLAVLLSPSRDYALARALKSPLFALPDDALAELAAADGDSLYDKLARNRAPQFRRARILLKLWRRRAETTLLPAHDFLSRLFAQGEVFARYHAATPPTLRFQVRENLSRLLDLSLQIAGGARPLLPQFMHEIRRADDSKKETAAAPNAVRLMSIHKAKGLESPVVILTDTDMARSGGRGDSADIYTDWPPDSDSAENFVIVRRRYRRAFAKMKQKAKAAEERETKNLFYVAATRAERALIIFSEAKPGGIAARAYDAMRRLSSATPDETKMAFGDSFCETESECKNKSGIESKTESKAESNNDSQNDSDSKTETADIGKRVPQTAAAVRGEIRHRIVALLLSGVSPEDARRLAPAEDAQWREAQTIASSPPLQKILQNAEEILIERDFFLDGEIVRPDLVVAGKDAVWIVDVKTGAPDPARHRPQLQKYRRAVAARYPARPFRLAVLDIRGEMHLLDPE